MNICPDNLEALGAALSAAHAKRERIHAVDLQAFRRVVEYHPEDMTITAEAGLTLAELQRHLAAHGQWLPLDPANADRATLAEILNENASGPRRFGYGTIREHLIGLRVVLADGRIIKTGGKVVKNVAGYDLQKLFVGSQGTLGVVVEVTFKVRPAAEKEEFVAIACPTLETASERIEAVLASDLSPIVLDLHNLRARDPQAGPASETGQATKRAGGGGPFSLVVGYDGTSEEVEWQKAKVSALAEAVPTNLEYDRHFTTSGRNGSVHRHSSLPSRLTEVIATLGCEQFVARAGNGVVYYRGGTRPPKPEVPAALTQRVKDIFDPNRVFPELPL